MLFPKPNYGRICACNILMYLRKMTTQNIYYVIQISILYFSGEVALLSNQTG